MTEISEKAYKAVAFDGTEAIIPKSQVFGRDWEVASSDAYWISAWILSKKSLTYSIKKEALFSEATGKKLPSTKVTMHVPEKIGVKENIIETLKK